MNCGLICTSHTRFCPDLLALALIIKWYVFRLTLVFNASKFNVMNNRNEAKKEGPKNQDEKKKTKSSTDRKVGSAYTPATENARAKAGQSLRNNGTNVSYDEDR
jgi:hypothetical protein